MPQSKGKLAAVMVTHNRLAQLKLSLTALLGTAPTDVRHILVVDNASNDGTGAWLSTLRDARLHLLHLPQNIGGAGGFARGIAEARRLFDPDWLVVMDDDAAPEPQTCARFHALDTAAFDAIAAAVRHPNGAICAMNRPKLMPIKSGAAFWRAALRRGFGAFHIGDSAYEGQRIAPVQAASFVGLFLSRRALEIGGAPDETLFIYMDDILYTLGLSRQNIAIGFAPTLTFVHDCPSAQIPLFPLWKVYYYHRNLMRLYRKIGGPLFWLLWPFLSVIWATRMRHYPAQHRRRYLRMLFYAITQSRTALDINDPRLHQCEK